jgi:hypothetical protein
MKPTFPHFVLVLAASVSLRSAPPDFAPGGEVAAAAVASAARAAEQKRQDQAAIYDALQRGEVGVALGRIRSRPVEAGGAAEAVVAEELGAAALTALNRSDSATGQAREGQASPLAMRRPESGGEASARRPRPVGSSISHPAVSIEGRRPEFYPRIEVIHTIPARIWESPNRKPGAIQAHGKARGLKRRITFTCNYLQLRPSHRACRNRKSGLH